MIQFKDIRDAVINKLEKINANNNIYHEEVEQGFNAPAFFMKIIPKSTIRINKSTKLRSLTVDISYFSLNKSNEEDYTIVEELEKAFGFALEIKERVLSIKDIAYEFKENVLHCKLNMEYYEAIDEIKENNEVYLINKINMKECR